MQGWHSRLLQHSSCVSYIMFKPIFNCEKYLTSLPMIKRVYTFILRNLKLPVVTCQYMYENSDDTCKLFEEGKCDEAHYLFVCQALMTLIQSFITPHIVKNTYCPVPIQLQSLLSISDTATLSEFWSLFLLNTFQNYCIVLSFNIFTTLPIFNILMF